MFILGDGNYWSLFKLDKGPPPKSLHKDTNRTQGINSPDHLSKSWDKLILMRHQNTPSNF